MAANEKTNRELQCFIATEVRRILDTVKVMSAERKLSEVRHERLFGCVEVDIRVTDHLRKNSVKCALSLRTQKSATAILETS